MNNFTVLDISKSQWENGNKNEMDTTDDSFELHDNITFSGHAPMNNHYIDIIWKHRSAGVTIHNVKVHTDGQTDLDQSKTI